MSCLGEINVQDVEENGGESQRGQQLRSFCPLAQIVDAAGFLLQHRVQRVHGPGGGLVDAV